MSITLVAFLTLAIFITPQLVFAAAADTDKDGLSDQLERDVYKTDPVNPDTDGDGYSDGDEVAHDYDPGKPAEDKLEKDISIDLKTQTLSYGLGPYRLASFKISSGAKGYETPTGEFAIGKKLPKVLYKGKGYYYPNTKWNLFFFQGSEGGYYIHGAYWHNRFGTPVSHGCINVSYKNMEGLYNWALMGTKVVIR